GEDEVVADRADGEPGVAPPLVDLDFVDQGADFLLHPREPDHRVQLGQQLVDLLGVLLGGSLDRADTDVGRAVAAGRRLPYRRVRALLKVQAGLGGVLDDARLDQTSAAPAEHDADALGVVDPRAGDRGRALVGHRDAHVTGTRDVAALDRRAGRLVEVHAAEPAAGDRGVADGRVGTQPYDQAVLGH